MAANTVGDSPQLTLELQKPRVQNYYCNGDQLQGILSANVPFELTHQGIVVTLSGCIINKSSEVYMGAANAGMLRSGESYEFMKLMRDLEGPGTLQPGNFDFSFNFRNLAFEADSYIGISLDVVF